MTSDFWVIGLDFGSDSVRAVLVNANNGTQIASSVFNYPRWQKALYCDAKENRFRQHPLDYIEGVESTIRSCIQQAGGATAAQAVKAISVDTTGSTPVAVDKTGTPLALLDEFAEEPDAMFVLWKDHTSVKEAADINAHAQTFPINYLQYVGGIYSSEWFWAKLLHVLRTNEKVRSACYSWVEHCDWIPFLLTGGTDVHAMMRSRCAAGHKGLWAEQFGGLPPEEFFSSLDPLLAGFRGRLYEDTFTSDQVAGKLSPEWAERLGLSTDVIVGVGAFDAHMGAVGGQIEPYYLSKVMGTSTCDILIAPNADMQDKLVKGICGQVNGSVVPDMIGLEAGQSAFGDTYAWFKNLIAWPLQQLLPSSKLIDRNTADQLIAELNSQIIAELSNQAQQLPLEDNAETAVDWLNGRRTPDANQLLKAGITGLNLASDAPRVFRALVESTCFGARAIVDRYVDQGIPVKGLIGIGGVAKKSPYIMQMMADVLGMPIKIHAFEHTCALGAAMFAATAAGVYAKVEDAMSSMGGNFEKTYHPDSERVKFYQDRYAKYNQLAGFLEQSIQSH